MRSFALLAVLVTAAWLVSLGADNIAVADDNRPPPDLERGRRVYESSCAPCHGQRGDGRGTAARFFEPRPRDFTKGLYKLRSTESGQLPTDEDLLLVIDNGMPGSAMPGWKHKLSLADRYAVIDYIKSFSKRFRRKKRPPEPRPEPTQLPPATAQLRAEGEALYRLMQCWACHGTHGRGDGESAPTLVDDWKLPIPPTNFVTGPLRAGTDPRAIFRVMDTGLNGTPMPAYGDSVVVGREAYADMKEIMKPFTETERQVARAYVATMPTTDQVMAMTDEQAQALAHRRLWALAIYVSSLRDARGLTDYLFLDEAGRYVP